LIIQNTALVAADDAIDFLHAVPAAAKNSSDRNVARQHVLTTKNIGAFVEFYDVSCLGGD